MDNSKVVAEYRHSHNIGEVPICGIDPATFEMKGTNGCLYREVDTNIWMNAKEDDGIAYVGTSRHAGGVVLRPLFLNIEGIWLNAVTGRETDFPKWRKKTADAVSVPGLKVLDPGLDNATGELPLQQKRRAPSLKGDWRGRCASLVNICEAFSWSETINDLYRHMADAVAEVLGCSDVYFNLFVAEGVRRMGVAYHTDGSDLFRWEGYFGPESSINLRWMLDVAEPLVLDLSRDSLPELIESKSLNPSSVCAIAFPIQSMDAIIGICFALFDELQSIDEEDKEFLMLVGRMLGVFAKRMRDTRNAFELQALDERRTVSRKIRDNVVTLMGSLSLNAAAAAASLEDGDYDCVGKDLDRLEGAAAKAMGILGDELSLLDMPLDESHGFVEGVKQCLAQFETSWGIATELDLSAMVEDRPVRIVIGLQLTQILGECLSNILKYAHANKVTVSLADDAHCFSMIVEDDGCGFDVHAAKGNSYGIETMRQRARAAGGELAIFSDCNGTSVCVDIPYEKSRWQGR